MFRRIRIFAFCIAVLGIFSYVMYYLSCFNPLVKPAVANTSAVTYTIVIDAGHGGADGGAVSSDGTKEDAINLAIAQKLNEMLSCMGINTVMTRNDENSIHSATAKNLRQQKVSDIHNRMDIMNSTDNALFVSIHQNFYNDSSLWGTQVFFSGNNPESENLAKNIQSRVIGLLEPENDRVVKKSGSSIYLLYKATKPAVLVECGFLSNPSETAKLKDEDYQSQMAFSIMCGILDYLSEKDV